ncbi:MAG: phospholipase D-like domain-containing protein, partial [Cephaloticoccus sp.]
MAPRRHEAAPALARLMDYLISHPYLQAVLSHLLTVAGFLLAIFLIARLMSEKRQPGNTFAWLLGGVIIPYLGVPLYLLFGGRKLRRLMNRKSRQSPTVPGDTVEAGPCAERHVARAVRSAGGSLPLGRNEMTLLTNGEDAYRALAEGIEQAKECIHITTFILGREDTGKRIVQLLAKRAREGVRVRLLLDSVGSMFIRRGFVAPIIEAGGEVQWFMRVLPLASRGSANLRSHRKIAVFDHRTAIVGGHNIAREYMGAKPWAKRWADFGAVIRGPAAAMFNDVFIADWCFASNQSIENIRAEIPAAAVAQEWRGQGRIAGKVTDENGAPIEGVIVKATLPSSSNRGPAPVKTNAKGDWSIGGITGGMWAIDFDREGYEPVSKSVQISEFNRLPATTLVMKKVVVVVDPNDVIKERLTEAAGLMMRKEFVPALAIYEALATQYPTVKQFKPLIARAQYGAGRTPDAIATLKAAVADDPAAIEIQVLLGTLLIETGQMAEGQQVMASIDASKVTDPTVLLNIGIDLI